MLSSSSVRRMNWGCGPITPLGWINSDCTAYPGVDVVIDIRQGLPLPDNDLDYIVGVHVLPEIPYSGLDQSLRELYRVLKPGGVLRLSLPDMDLAIRAYLSGDVDYFLIGDEVVKSLAGKMVVQLTWYGRSRCLFNSDFTQELLLRNGFRDVVRCEFQKTSTEHRGITELDDRPLESLFVEASK